MNFVKAAVAATFVFAAPAAQAEEASYILATASTGGTYYPVGVALSTLVKVKLEPSQKNRHVRNQLCRIRRECTSDT
jgi:hypothetical protein